jgi:hypothetical protein
LPVSVSLFLHGILILLGLAYVARTVAPRAALSMGGGESTGAILQNGEGGTGTAGYNSVELPKTPAMPSNFSEIDHSLVNVDAGVGVSVLNTAGTGSSFGPAAATTGGGSFRHSSQR